jgi:hypothetical protein
MLMCQGQLDCVADLCALIRAEYREMPGLNLTLRQAIRRWAAEPDACARALDALVREGILDRSGSTYKRADCGRRCA